jgi:hypothetical protein
MTLTANYSASDANSTLFVLIRTFESGSSAGNYGLNTGIGAYGAYQMRAGALEQIGAIRDQTKSLTDPSNWTGDFGKSLGDFLGSKNNQDGAAAAYLNNYVVPTMNRLGAADQVGGTFSDTLGNDVPITQNGLLLAGWNVPAAAADEANSNFGAKNAPQPGTDQYFDTLSRFQAGAMADGELVFDPTDRATAKSQAVTDFFGTTNVSLSPISLEFDTGDIAWNAVSGGNRGQGPDGTQYFQSTSQWDGNNPTTALTSVSPTVSGVSTVNYWSSFQAGTSPDQTTTLTNITGPITLSGGIVSVGGSQPFNYNPITQSVSGTGAVSASIGGSTISIITPSSGSNSTPFAVISTTDAGAYSSDHPADWLSLPARRQDGRQSGSFADVATFARRARFFRFLLRGIKRQTTTTIRPPGARAACAARRSPAIIAGCRTKEVVRGESGSLVFRTLIPVLLLIVFIKVGSLHVVAAETDGFDQWTGLWCSGCDEIGITAPTGLGRRADGETAPLYLYVRLNLGDTNSYTVDGPVTPYGDSIELADGECGIHAELRGTQMIVTDNHRCDKISAAFQHREFNRIRRNIVSGHHWRSKQHCSGMTSD